MQQSLLELNAQKQALEQRTAAAESSCTQLQAECAALQQDLARVQQNLESAEGQEGKAQVQIICMNDSLLVHLLNLL
jgi:septal ring factor EnvC (AmiA/AmiB activator)